MNQCCLCKVDIQFKPQNKDKRLKYDSLVDEMLKTNDLPVN